jgi:hypothetical protein
MKHSLKHPQAKATVNQHEDEGAKADDRKRKATGGSNTPLDARRSEVQHSKFARHSPKHMHQTQHSSNGSRNEKPLRQHKPELKLEKQKKYRLLGQHIHNPLREHAFPAA